MLIRIGLENNMDGHSIAWVLDHPGCFANGKDGKEALVNVPRAVIAYQAWLDSHMPDSWLKELKDFDIRLVETFECTIIDENYEPAKEGYEIDAWFMDYWKPLTRQDVLRGKQLLSFSRADLLQVTEGIDAARLDREYPGERWSIRGVLKHVANADWWYLSRLEKTGYPTKELPDDVFERLKATRARLEAILPELEGVELVMGKQGELWSPRKLLHRALWHELDHIDHIKKLLAK